jgi:hypothetical protein
MSSRMHPFVIGLFITLVAVDTYPANVTVGKERPKQVAGVDNSRMGAYRSLAQLSFGAYQKNDLATAAELARILERTWDAAEEGGGPKSLEVVNKLLFEQIDESMDKFIKPLMRYATNAPDPATVQEAYTSFLAKLRQADE